MSGVGGRKPTLVTAGEMHWIGLAGKKHFDVPCLYLENAYINISVYSYGVICMLVLSKCELILDYAHGRAAFIPC